jgi:monothiol glutaredoxin
MPSERPILCSVWTIDFQTDSRHIAGIGRKDLIPMSDNPVFDRIRDDIGSNDVVLYMKGTPVFPQCGFSAAVVQVLSHLGVKFKGIDILQDPSLRQGVKEFTNWPTIPQLYVKGEFVGGCDIIREMYESGELQQLLKDKGVASSQAA